ncbi:FCD domain-containing protein [Streptomyces sp. NPDC047002]|uniref:FadR/GntR family transcriptional regulator n=1 Tax=Streptomyces sp. NPDC047002 TaxID=3155475 RepID=UPI003455FF72
MASYAGRGTHGRVVEQLGYRVVSGEVPEGATLDPRELVGELGVSLTVVREALRVLATKELVASRQKRGTFVRPRAEWNTLDADVIRWRVACGKGESLLRDLQELRVIVEPAAVRCAALRRTDDDLAALDLALGAMAGARGERAAAEADAAFHRALLRASGNEMLTRLDDLMKAALQARDSLVHGAAGAAGDPVPSHRAVLDAVRERDQDRAAAAMADLLALARADADHALRTARPPRDASATEP